MALLPAISLDFRHRETVNANGGQGVTDFFKLEWLDDRHNNFHGSYPRLARPEQTGRSRLRFTTRRSSLRGHSRPDRIKCRARSAGFPNGLPIRTFVTFTPIGHPCAILAR